MVNCVGSWLQENLVASLERGCEMLAVRLSPIQHASLLEYLVQLNKWNSVYNLTAVRTPSEQTRVHVLDCLSIIPTLRPYLASHKRVLDVGSGAGLPGVMLAIAFPDVEVHCIDAVAKKSAFLTQLRGALQLPNLHSHHGRVEHWKDAHVASFPLVVSRAFASLKDFVELTRPAIAPQGTWFAMKGTRPDDELRTLPADIEVVNVERLHVPDLNAERHLVQLRRVADASNRRLEDGSNS